jgi:DNA-binding transcriptional LysR family regulator
MDLNLARTLVSVVEAGSFTAAARSLGLPESAVRSAVTRLEARLGADLFDRKSGQLKLTTAGRAYYHCAAGALAELAEAEHAVAEARGEPRGLVRLAVPLEMSREFLSSVVMPFVAQHRAVRVDVSFSNRNDDLASEKFDLALQVGRRPHSKQIEHKVAQIDGWLLGGWLFAAPAYLKSHPLLCSPSDLKQHKCIVQDSPAGAHRIWPLVGPRGPEPVGVTAAVNSDDILFTYQLVLRSAGIALLPAMLGIDDLRAGTLARVLADYEVPTPELHLILPSSSPPPRRVALFRDALIEALRTTKKEPGLLEKKPGAREGETEVRRSGLSST